MTSRSTRSRAASILTNLALAGLPSLLFIVVALEIFFRFVLPGSETPNRVFDEADGIVHYDTQGPSQGLFTRGRFAQVRARWNINNYGWNSEADYAPRTRATASRPLIALIGDSYVNAFQVEPDESQAAVLHDLLGGRYDVYRFGMPGAPLSQYLQMSRYVARHFDPDVMVFLLIHNDFHESLRELAERPAFLQLDRDDGSFVETRPTAAGIQPPPLWLKSATARYLKVTLRSYLLAGSPKPGEARRFVANVAVDELERERPLIAEATRFLIRRIRDENRDRKLLFMMDAPRFDLYAGSVEQSPVWWLNRLVAETCESLGVPFLDLTNHFSEVHRARGERFESAVDSHWNETGHREAARALAARLAEVGVARAGAR